MSKDIKEIRTDTKKGQICIPNSARNLSGFKEGSKITVIVYDDKVELRPLKKGKMNNALLCMLASEEALAENWLSKEDEEARKDL